MKRMLVVFLCLVTLMIGFICGRYSPLESALAGYCQVVQGDMPEDIRLTIYGRSFWDKTDTPISKEDVMADHDIKVEVGPEKLASYWQEFRYLSPAVLKEASEKNGQVRARVYYTLEVGDGAGNYEKILEVYQDDLYGNHNVNGVEVENSIFLHDLILLFVTDDERYLLYV